VAAALVAAFLLGLACLLAVAPPSAAAKTTKPGAHRLPSVTLQWVGDMAMSSERGLPPGGVAEALRPVSGFLHGADLTTGNLEGTLSVGGPSKCGGATASATCFAFQAPPPAAFGLRRLGFGLVNQANNHALDYGPSGQAQTLDALKRAGIAETGLPGQITRLKVNGIKLAFLGFAPYPFDSNLLDIPAAQALVRQARQTASVVVVFIHAGAEGAGQLHTPAGEQFYLGEDRGNARAFAHAVIAAGASVVLGSGPHVIRGVQRFHNHLIAYSLGNFVGYHTLGGGGVLDDSGILRATLDAKGGLLAARWISIRLDEGLPRPDPSNAAARLVGRLSGVDFPATHYRIKPDGRFVL
jgi:poly-gamma-glutamate capsule biosynthesis protein CapA/YwtB (metallophosphatase superfamily)